MAFNDEIMVASGEEYDPEHPSTEKATLEKIQSGGAYKTDDPTESTIDNADYFPFYDTSASAKKKTLWSTIVDKLKTILLPLTGGTVTGTLILSNTTDASGTSDTNPALKIGNVTGQHLELDTNELMSKASATTVGPLYINNDGGTVAINGKTAAKVTGTPTSGQVLVADGTDGSIKTSGYTIAKSVPSNALFTDNNTTYTFATGDSNGQIKVTPSGGSGQNVSVKGLGSNAYTSTAYLPLTGGTLTGKVASSATIMSTSKIASGDVLQSAVGVYAGAINADIAGTTYTNKAGYVRICDATGHYAAIVASTMGSNRTITLPNASGKVALTSDLDDYLTIIDAQEIGRLLNEKMPISGGTFTGNITVNRGDGTTSSVGSSSITAGNSTASGTAKNSYGQVVIYSQQSAGVRLRAQDLTSARNLYLPASGTALATSASSSARVKENIRDMTEEEALKILDIDVVKFDYKEEYEDGLLDQSGVIAEEVLDIIPEVVSIHPMYDETKAIDPASNPSPTVDYGKFAPYLIKMVQMQQEKIEELEQRLAALDN